MAKTMKKRGYRKKSSSRRNKTSKVAFAVKKYVNSTIHRNIENKKHITTSFNNSITGPQFVLSLVPPLNQQGGGESQRIGNVVTLRKASIRFLINQIPYNALTNPYGGPVHFRWMLISQRRDNTQTLALTSFFETNNGSQGITGTHLNQLLPVNDDLYKVHKTGKFRLANTAQSNNFPVGGSNFDNSKLSLEKSIYFDRYLTKKMKFDDVASSTSTNTNLWLVILCSYANGSTTADYLLANISYVISWEYEDA